MQRVGVRMSTLELNYGEENIQLSECTLNADSLG